MIFQKYISSQIHYKNPENLTLKLVNLIVSFLLNETPENLQLVFKDIAVLSENYNILLNIDKKKKKDITKNKIEKFIGELMLNNNGLIQNLPEILNLIVWFAQNKNFKVLYR